MHGTGDAAHAVAQVELDHLGSVARAGVGQGDGGGDFAVLVHLRLVQADVTVLERGVRQAVAEGVERLVGHVEVVAAELRKPVALFERASGVLVVVVERNLPHVAGEGHAQLAAGVDVAEQHVADGIGGLAAPEPHVQDGRHVLLLPIQRHGTSREEGQHDGLAGLQQGFEQAALRVGDADVAAAGALARHFGGFAQGGHDDVGTGSHGQRLVQQLLVGAVVTVQRAAEHGGVLLLLGVAHQVAALGVKDFDLLSGDFFQAFVQRGVVVQARGHAPRAGHVAARITHRADDGHRALLLQREYGRLSGLGGLVLQQHETAGGDASGSGAVFGVEHFLGRTLQVAILVGVVKQAELPLRLEDAAAGLVDVCHADFAFVERLLQRADEAVADHVHVNSRFEGAGRHLLQVAYAVGNHLVDARVVGHDKAVELPLVAQQVGHQPTVGRGGHPVDLVERGHDAACSRLNGCLVGQEIFVVHAVAAHVDRVIVASGLRGAVECEVLDASHDLVVGLELCRTVGALVATHHGPCNGGTQEGVFTAALADASPARVAADVDHRAERPADAVGAGFGGRDAGRLFHGVHVPRARQAQGDGEHRFVAVYDIHAEQQGDAQARVLDRQALHVAYAFDALQIEQAAHQALLDKLGHVAALGLPGDYLAGDGQVELADFFFYCHLAHQFRDERVHVARRGRRGFALGRGRGQQGRHRSYS